jgi:septal ring factor EnvC (AmiA/AmiB activator)
VTTTQAVSAAPLDFTTQQITTVVLAIIGVFGLRVLMPLFGLVNGSRAETRSQYLAQIAQNREEIADLKADNRKLHERIGEQASDQRQLASTLAEVQVEIRYVKAANAQLLTDNAKLEAENVSLQLASVKQAADSIKEIAIRDLRIQALEDEVDEQLIYLSKPTKYERLRNPTSVPAENEASPRRFDVAPVQHPIQ